MASRTSPTAAAATLSSRAAGRGRRPRTLALKTVLDDYGSGLSDILRLRPVVYRYKGNVGDEHKHVAESRKTFIGLVAQEAELVMPELVTMSAGEIDGKKVDDLRTLDSTALIYALINSVKELKAEIEELKAVSTAFKPIEIPPGVVSTATKKMRSSNWRRGQCRPLASKRSNSRRSWASRPIPMRSLHAAAASIPRSTSTASRTSPICASGTLHVDTGGVLTGHHPDGRHHDAANLCGKGYSDGNYSD